MEDFVGFINKYRKVFKLIGTAVLLYFAIRYALPLFAPFVLSYLVAGMLRPVVWLLYKECHIKPILGAFIVLLLFLFGVTVLFGFGIFKLCSQIAYLVENLPAYESLLYEWMHGFCSQCDTFFRLETGEMHRILTQGFDRMSLQMQESFLPELTEHSVKAVSGVLSFAAGMFVFLIATLLMLKEVEKDDNESFFRKNVSKLKTKLTEAGAAYLKTQGILFLIISLLCTIGLTILQNKYALLLGMLIGLVDAFPFIGSGIFLLPWVVVSVLKRQYKKAIILVVLYITCQLVRELSEPKLLGDKIGIKPIYTLLSVYLGVRLFGVLGVFFGPISFLILKTVARTDASC